MLYNIVGEQRLNDRLNLRRFTRVLTLFLHQDPFGLTAGQGSYILRPAAKSLLFQQSNRHQIIRSHPDTQRFVAPLLSCLLSSGL